MSKELIPNESVRQMLADAGYAEPAINYFLEKKYIGRLQNASHVSQKIGSCGDIMKIYIQVNDHGIIEDVRYEITGCAGAISAAMATVDIIKGKNLEEALKINDGDLFKMLESVPIQKHHCIQLAIETMHQCIKELKAEQKK